VLKAVLFETELIRGGNSVLRVAGSVLDLIGNTPMVKLSKISAGIPAELWGKVESLNPGGSVKDRVALSMIRAAEKEGRLVPGGTIVEPTSGNTGIGLAMVAAVLGYNLIVTMPEGMSVERVHLLEMYGARVELTGANRGMTGAIERAEQLVAENPEYYMLRQFDNEANPEIHRLTTGPEIMEQMQGKISVLVAGVGTGGTLTGTAEFLRERIPDLQVVAVEPVGSAVLSGGEAGPHKIQGLGAGFIPAVLNVDTVDRVIKVSDEDALETSRKLAQVEGLLVGISAGAAVHAAIIVGRELEAGERVIVILPDTGERYLSLPAGC